MEYRDKKEEKREQCHVGSCEGIPVLSGECVFHSTTNNSLIRGAMSVYLRDNPIYHRLANQARLCGWYDPPRSKEEWNFVHECARLLNRAGLLPKEINVEDKNRFFDLLNKTEKVLMFDHRVFDAHWIGYTLEQFLIAHVTKEAERIALNIANKNSLIAETENEAPKPVFRRSDFEDFANLPIFNTGAR